MEVETSIAKCQTPADELFDPFLTYNPMNISELKTLAPGLDWDNYIQVHKEKKRKEKKKKRKVELTILINFFFRRLVLRRLRQSIWMFPVFSPI